MLQFIDTVVDESAITVVGNSTALSGVLLLL